MLYEKFKDSIIYEMSMTEALDGSKEGEVVLKGARYARMLSAIKNELVKYKKEIAGIEDLNKKERVLQILSKIRKFSK